MSEKSYLEPSLRLFLSVDLIGSTAYKASTKINEWLQSFRDFFDSFQVYLAEAVNEPKNLEPFSLAEVRQPTFWKALGDELIFTVRLTDHRQAALYCVCFKQAVERYQSDLDRQFKSDKGPRLGVKATAWTAGFPVGNAPIPMSFSEGDSNGQRPTLDFIGPNMDIGFRLTKLTTDLRFTISVELALLIASCATQSLRICYSGRESLKGVLKGIEYPNFWIQMDKTISSPESDLFPNLSEANIKAYAINFLDKHKKLIRPFIVGDQVFGQKPPEYQKWYDEAIEAYNTLEDNRDFDFHYEDSKAPKRKSKKRES